MRKLILLFAFLASTLVQAEPNVQTSMQSTHPDTVNASMISAVQAPSKHDDPGRKLIVYSLIISIYGFYWYKQKV